MKLTETIIVDDFFIVEDDIPIITKTVGVRVYDFNFRNFFNVRSVLYSPSQPVIARIGAFEYYSATYTSLAEEGIILVHNPEEHDRCSLLPNWYPLLTDLIPKSVVYESLPTAKVIEKDFNWPVFVKGERQTNKHKKSLSVIENPDQFEVLLVSWKQDKMLHWQKMICREFIPLQIIEDTVPDRIPSSYEFRMFYWKQQLVSIGRYWHESIPYQLSDNEQAHIGLANEVAQRILVCFLVVDVARTAEGKWIVIEINDGQESGYAGNMVSLLWENIIRIEKATSNLH